MPIFTPSAVPSPTPFLPTATPIPSVAIVNGEPVPLVEFQAEMQRYRQAREAAGQAFNESEARQVVLETMIRELLLAQAARQAGFQVTDTLLQSRLDALIAERGGEEAFQAWMKANGYDALTFRRALGRAIQAAWMRDQIIAKVPTQAEQVHVMQILFYNEQEAQQAWQSLQSGVPFEKLARQYDALTGGDLGWFPRGYLLEPVIEEEAFRLKPGEYSGVLKSEIGFHIIKVLERAVRPLSPRALYLFQQRALEEWLRQQRETSQIQIIP
ncbi:MAG: peptidylprolyl isomerase [Chloroflexi bacterium]|nr:peptidylprolyl isomerase [Chloroflexota bacterium]